MRPIRLSISAFGAFAEQVEIDFAALASRGLFLVSGETGAGKSTIFDAMCWALYGDMPLKESSEVRSDHVDATTRCEVTFTFDSGGARYTVTRNPKQLRPAKRRAARAVNEDAAATLVRVRDDGTTELVAGKVSEVARACEAIIGLDATQFQRVVLLPQGDFNRFLLAGSGDREKILERLFGGAVYDRIVDELKVARDAGQAELGSAEAAITTSLVTARGHVDAADAALAPEATPLDESTGPDDSTGGINIHTVVRPTTPVVPDEAPEAKPGPDRDALAAAVRRLEGALVRCRDGLGEAEAERKAAQAAHDRATTGAERFDQAGAFRATLAELDRRSEAIESGRAAATVSAKARPIVEAADALSAAEESHRDAVAVRDERARSIVAALSALGAPSEDLAPLALQRQIGELRTAHAGETEKLERRGATEEALDTAEKTLADLEGQVDAAGAALTTATARADEIDAVLPELRAAAVDPVTIRAAIESAEHLAEDRSALAGLEADLVPLSERRAATADEHRRLLLSFTHTQAPRLATTRVVGNACPVCGSTEHPAPATAGDQEIVGWDEVAAAENHHSEADRAVRNLESRITELRGRLGDSAAVEVAVLQQRVEDHRAELSQATSAATRVEILESERRKLNADVSGLTTDVARLRASRDQAARDLAEASEAARTATEAAAGLDPAALELRASDLDQLGGALDGFDELVRAVAGAASLLEGRRGDLTRRLAGSDHETVDAARAVVWTPDQEQAAIESAEKHQSECVRIDGALKALEPQGIPEQRPDPAGTEAALASTEATKQRLETLVATLDFNVRGAASALEECDRLTADSGDVRTRAELATRAHQVCAKGGPVLPVALKRWVLAHELERITTAANAHLGTMTNGRYSLHPGEAHRDRRQAAGLGLVVDDTDTGRPRSTASLSGGEQFQASLALALGLADVISHGGTAGGQHFEALFVDEGFGSLSADALDDAVETLYRLHGSGRVVGAITHVEAMKQALHVGIEVARRADGRGSTLVVNP